jgi:hypothetical protein
MFRTHAPALRRRAGVAREISGAEPVDGGGNISQLGQPDPKGGCVNGRTRRIKMRNVRYSRFRPKADLKLSRKRTPTRVQCILQWIYVPYWFAYRRVSFCRNE